MCSPPAHLSGTERGTAQHCPECRTMLRTGPPNLLLEYFFDLPDLLFNFAGVFFGGAFGL
jgi:hypothetical protein